MVTYYMMLNRYINDHKHDLLIYLTWQFLIFTFIKKLLLYEIGLKFNEESTVFFFS